VISELRTAFTILPFVAVPEVTVTLMVAQLSAMSVTSNVAARAASAPPLSPFPVAGLSHPTIKIAIAATAIADRYFFMMLMILINIGSVILQE
jgi:hypothetical protein